VKTTRLKVDRWNTADVSLSIQQSVSQLDHPSKSPFSSFQYSSLYVYIHTLLPALNKLTIFLFHSQLGWALGKPLSLLFDPFESITLFLSVLLVNYSKCCFV